MPVALQTEQGLHLVLRNLIVAEVFGADGFCVHKGRSPIVAQNEIKRRLDRNESDAARMGDSPATVWDAHRLNPRPYALGFEQVLKTVANFF